MTLSPRLRIIADMVPNGSRVLDIGCSQGHLLQWLAEHKRIYGRGIEICETKVQSAIAQGMSVVQGDAEQDLPHYPDNAYDIVILNEILQQMQHPKEVLAHAARVARHIIVSVPNFAHWRNRWQLAVSGQMPVTHQLDYEWYETPNIHFCTLKDFHHFCTILNLRIQRQHILYSPALPNWLSSCQSISNVCGQQGIFLLSATQNGKNA